MEHTFTFICGFIQDGLGRHNLAIPLKTVEQETRLSQLVHLTHRQHKSTGITHKHEWSAARHESASACPPLSAADADT